MSASEDLLGKDVTDLQEDIEIDPDEGTIEGTLKHVTGYTGFSGTAAEQSGNYLALHCEALPEADSITVELIGGTVGHPVTLDADGLIVLRITDNETQKIRVTAWKDGASVVQTYDLSGLTLEDS